MAVCRELNLLNEASVAIDGSKFKAVNARDKNFTEAKMKRRLGRIEESIARYIAQLETADRRGDAVPEAKVARFRDKIEKLNEEIARLDAISAELMKSEDKQISLTDPDARSMATSGKDTEIVGYNVQTAVDTKNHLIVAHEVTNVGTDRHQLSNMAEQARTEIGVEMLDVVADRGYYDGEEIKACEDADITVTLPKPMTSGAKAAGRFGKQDFLFSECDGARPTATVRSNDGAPSYRVSWFCRGRRSTSGRACMVLFARRFRPAHYPLARGAADSKVTSAASRLRFFLANAMELGRQRR